MADITAFGITSDGKAVQKITLRSDGLTACILTWGAVLQSVRLRDVAHDLTLGSDRLTDYENDMRYHGSLIAPVVNRLSGGQAIVDGTTFGFERNQDGKHCLHSGLAGTHLKVWDLVSASDTDVVLALNLPDGEGGFPGNRRVSVRFWIGDPATLQMEISATTDKVTIFNAANHSYWNLDGTGQWDGHSLQVMADRYLPTTGDFTPTGDIIAVGGTALDFRVHRRIDPHMPDLDNCFCLANSRGPLRDVMQLCGQSGVTLTVATTETGVQLYDGRAAIRPGGTPYEGIAIEAQGWPDAANHLAFPSITLLPDQPVCQITRWQLAKRQPPALM